MCKMRLEVAKPSAQGRMARKGALSIAAQSRKVPG